MTNKAEFDVELASTAPQLEEEVGVELSESELKSLEHEISDCLQLLDPYLSAENVTIVKTRRFGEVTYEQNGVTTPQRCPNLNYDYVLRLVTLVNKYVKKQALSYDPKKSPEFNGHLPSGAPFHVEFPPLSQGEIYLTIKPLGNQRDNASLSVRQLIKPLNGLLHEDGITEICINEPTLVFYQKNGQWLEREIPELTYANLKSLGVALATYANSVFGEIYPILSAQLPTGERAQFVMPPACKTGTISVTIRRPTFGTIPLSAYEESGFFKHLRPKEKHDPIVDELKGLYQGLNEPHVPQEEMAKRRSNFLRRCVELGQNIVICGETGSGKTTFMKALMQAIPTSERIITIEDVPELLYGLTEHKNQVNLFYPSEAKEGDLVTATSLLKSCLRMKPDRILLAELRGGETYDYLNICLSGHGGSITSCHSGSAKAAFEYLTLKVMQNPTGQHLSYEVIQRMLHQAINVVVHIHNSRDIGRHITEIYYDPEWMQKEGAL